MPLRQSGKHAHLKDLIAQSVDEEELVPKTSIFIHYAQTVPPTRTKRLEHFFGPDVLLRDTSTAATRNPEHDNMLGNTKAGALAIDKALLQDFRDHWDSFCVLEKQQVLMSFVQMDPGKLKTLGKEGRESIFDIIDNKAQMDEDQWVVTLSRVMRNFPRSNSIRANSADRESWYFLNKQVEKGLEAGFQAASSSKSTSHAEDNLEEHAQGRKAKRSKTDINDSIPPMGSHCSSCWPLKRHGHPAEYAVVDSVAERLWKPIRDAAREEIATTCAPGWKLFCDYDSDDPVKAGLRPGLDLQLPPKAFVEYLQTERKQRFSREHLADEVAWDNSTIHRNGEWQKKPEPEREEVLRELYEPKALLGFERTPKDFHAALATSPDAPDTPSAESGEAKKSQLSFKTTGNSVQQLPALSDLQDMQTRVRTRRSSGITDKVQQRVRDAS